MTIEAVIELVVVTIVGVLTVTTAGVYAVRKHWESFRDVMLQDAKSVQRKIESTTAVMNGALQDFCEPLDYPCWYKLAEYQEDGTVVFYMQYLNAAYEREFGKPRDEYVGQTDFQVWPREIAEVFFAHDASVLASGKQTRFVEQVPVNINNPSGPKVAREFDKWIIKRNGKVGIAGMMRPVIAEVIVDDDGQINGDGDA
jgi:PAS domain-containing protein